MSNRLIIFFIGIVIFSFNSFAQNEYNYFGAIKLNDSSFITYRLVLKNDNGKVSGYSLTDLGGNHETRSNVFGEYNEEKKEFNFRETGIVYTKSEITTEDFCFVNATIKGFRFGKSLKMRGNFVGLFSDNTKCISGEVIMNAEEKVIKRAEKVSKIISNSKKISDSVKQSINPKNIIELTKKNLLNKNETLSIFSSSDSIKMNLFDAGQEDGDRISIRINSTPILTNYEITNNIKEIVIPLVETKTHIEIIALNNGEIGSNTVKIKLFENDNEIETLTNLSSGERTSIDILRKK